MEYQQIGKIQVNAQPSQALPPRLIDDLDLMNLPQRLDDQTLERVQAIACAPLPAPKPCDERHLNKCLRIMLSVLPRQMSDELTGELFVAAYQRKLGEFSDEAISYMTDKALGDCRWFPTIAECIELASQAPRTDEAVRRKIMAQQIAAAEKTCRTEWEDKPKQRGPKLSQGEIDRMTTEMLELGLSCGILTRTDDGKVIERLDN